jgi:hypothetical protein
MRDELLKLLKGIKKETLILFRGDEILIWDDSQDINYYLRRGYMQQVICPGDSIESIMANIQYKKEWKEAS